MFHTVSKDKALLCFLLWEKLWGGHYLEKKCASVHYIERVVWKPRLFHITGCIVSPARGRVLLTCHTIFIWGTYCVCTSYGVWLNFVIASRFLKRFSAMPANVACSIHSRDTKTVWHSTRPFRVPVMQYIQCCGRGVVSRL